MEFFPCSPFLPNLYHLVFVCGFAYVVGSKSYRHHQYQTSSPAGFVVWTCVYANPLSTPFLLIISSASALFSPRFTNRCISFLLICCSFSFVSCSAQDNFSDGELATNIPAYFMKSTLFLFIIHSVPSSIRIKQIISLPLSGDNSLGILNISILTFYFIF